jgi:hypothetical protein
VKEWTIDKWNTIEIPEIDPHQYNGSLTMEQSKSMGKNLSNGAEVSDPHHAK